MGVTGRMILHAPLPYCIVGNGSKLYRQDRQGAPLIADPSRCNNTKRGNIVPPAKPSGSNRVLGSTVRQEPS